MQRLIHMDRKSASRLLSLVVGACLLAMLSTTAEAQDATLQEGSASQEAAAAAPPPPENDAQNLAKQLSNPIASLISFPLQSNYDWGLGPDGEGSQYTLNIQPVIPITLNDDWNLISRTIVPLVSQGDVVPVPPAADNNQFGFSDTVQSLFFSPQKPTKGGIVWGAGPVFLIPTATDKLIGSGKWGAGPTIVALKQSGPWTVGGLANHIWSVAGNDSRDKVSSTFLQPFVGYTTKRATTFTVNAESTYDWTHKQWTVPVNIMVAQLFKPKTFGLGFPIQIQVGYRHYFESAPTGPNDGVRLNIVALFPKK
jgi:hypothetical protein